MTNYAIIIFKSFIAAIALAVLVGTTVSDAAAQAPAKDASIPPGLYSPLDKFLIEDAKPPLRLSDVTRSAETMAWVIGGSFSNYQFDEYKAAVVSAWRAGDAETIGFVGRWVGHADQLASVKKYDDQVKLRERLKPVLVEDLKTMPDDPKRIIVRRVYRRTHGENSLGAFKVKPRLVRSSGELRDLVGDWIAQSTPGVNMKTEKLSILANGIAAFSNAESGQSGDCFVTQTLLKQGTAAVSGGTLSLTFPEVKLQRVDSCKPMTDAGLKPQAAESRKLTWQIKSDENEILWLCLAGADGKASCYKQAN